MDNSTYQPLADSREESSAKIPALTLLTHLGYEYLSPAQCSKMRGSYVIQEGSQKPNSQVMLLPVIRKHLSQQTFPFAGKEHPLSEAAIDKIMQDLNPAMN